MKPFEALYDHSSPINTPYFPKDSKVPIVDALLLSQEDTKQVLQQHFLNAQHKMKMMANRRRSKRQFQSGDQVYVKLQPYRQVIVHSSNQKLQPKYFGPFTILDKVG